MLHLRYNSEQIESVAMPPSDIEGSSGRSILNGLPPNTKQYPYTSNQHFLSITSHQNNCLRQSLVLSSQFLVFSNISPESYRNDFDENTSKVVDSYYPGEETLVVKVPTSTHEQAFRGFNNAVIAKLVTMGRANHGLLTKGAGEVKTPSRKKQVDEAYLPRGRPHDRSPKWPSIAVEPGYTDARRALKENAKWWINESSGDVKAVITTCVHKGRREIDSLRPVGVGGQWDDHCSAVRDVTKASPTATTRVTGSPLVISFEDLFLRPAVEPECDLQFDEDLAWIAETTREVQFSSD